MRLYRRNASQGCLREELARFRRPSLPSIPQNAPLMTSSIGHQRARRPSLADWANNMNRYHSVDIDEGQAKYIYAEFPEQDNTVTTVLLMPGMRLYEAFEEALRNRGLSVNEVGFFLINSQTPIPDNSEARFLAGQKVIVRSRGMRVARHSRAAHSMDDVDKPTRKMSAEAISRKSSFANSRMFQMSRSRQQSENRLNGSEEGEGRSNDSSQRDIPGIMDDASCSSEIMTSFPVDDGGTRRARSLATSRISLFFGKEKNELLARLSEMKADKIRMQPNLHFLDIEKHWKDIVKNSQDFGKSRVAQQEAIWELISTESRYIQVLNNMATLKDYLVELQRCGYLKDIRVDKVFLNYEELYRIHMRFWEDVVLEMVDQSRRNGRALDPTILLNWFESIGQWSRCYTDFTSSHNDSLHYLQKKIKDHQLFAEFVAWAESQDTMKRQKLADTLTVPMQRLTRYSLLLKAVLRETKDEPEKSILLGLVERVDHATNQLNVEMNNNDLRCQMEEISSQIDSYDCIDQEEFEKLFQGRRCVLELWHPMPLFPLHLPKYRRLFYRGELKGREGKQGAKVDLYCMLFTDMFLICRKKADRLRVYKPPLHIKDIIFHPLPDQLGFYIVNMSCFETPTHLFQIYTGGIEETRRWLEMIYMASHEFNTLQRETYTSSRDTPTDDLARGPFAYPPMPPNMNIHRKSSSMDSQTVAAHAHINHMHRMVTVSSTEQLDRHPERLDSSCRLPPRHKLSVASCIANPLSSSKSSVDLHLSMGAEANEERPRSRSNSSGADMEGEKGSRSPSPQRMCTPVQNDERRSNGRGGQDSPTLLITAENETPPTNGRRFEKRYHTADAIELKPKSMMGPNGIIKRFSLNVSSAMGASSRKISARLGGEHSRRHSQASTAASSESFGSSTSGISSASDGCHIETKTHITSVAVNGSPSESSLNISLDLPEEIEPLQSVAPPTSDLRQSPPAPPLPSIPPPMDAFRQQQLLQLILDNHLETSDV